MRGVQAHPGRFPSKHKPGTQTKKTKLYNSNGEPPRFPTSCTHTSCRAFPALGPLTPPKLQFTYMEIFGSWRLHDMINATAVPNAVRLQTLRISSRPPAATVMIARMLAKASVIYIGTIYIGIYLYIYIYIYNIIYTLCMTAIACLPQLLHAAQGQALRSSHCCKISLLPSTGCRDTPVKPLLTSGLDLGSRAYPALH